MESKIRPFSSKPITTLPIHVDQNQYASIEDTNLIQSYSNKTKPKLNQIVPQLPHSGRKSNITALLYSKFVVKGLKEDKLSVVKSALKKKQEITEAGTNQQYRVNKSARTLTATKTLQNPPNFQAEPEESTLNQNLSCLQINSLARASSAKVFKKQNYRQISENSNKNLIRNSTQTNLHKSRRRPTTAKVNNFIQYKEDQDQNRLTSAKKQRPTTAALSRKNNTAYMPNQSFYQTVDLHDIVTKKFSTKPIKVVNERGIDYIQRNIQNASTYFKKTSSIYLTGANIEHLSGRKKTQSIYKSSLFAGDKFKKQIIKEDELQLKPQQQFLKADKQKHEKSMKKIENYLIQAIPSKFQLITQEMKKEQKRNQVDYEENFQQLLSKDLDSHIEDTQEQMNERSAKACFEDYIQSCEVMQYNISSKLKEEEAKQETQTTLNIMECQKIIETYKQIQFQTDIIKRSCKISEIREITKNLKYFSHKSKQEIDRLFTVPFEIIVVEEGSVLIYPNTSVQNIYIILNGSVVAQSIINSNSQHSKEHLANNSVYYSQMSLYDGEIFGEIARPSQNVYKVRVTTLEQSLLMKVKYNDYTSILLEGNEIQQKLQILKFAFKAQLNNEIIKQQDLQMISLSLQKHKYPSKSIIFRQGQIYEKLVFVGKGKLKTINEYVLEQEKIKSKDMKELDKHVRQQPQISLKIEGQSTFPKYMQKSSVQMQEVTLESMRRQNLINYEVIKQNSKKLYYYFMKQQAEMVKGDIINWQPILHTFSHSVDQNNLFSESIHAVFSLGINLLLKPVTYSLMSNCDETQIYTLSRQAFQYLPNEIKKILLSKGREQINKNQIKVQSEKEIKQWNNYKQKLCDSIIKEKKEKRQQRL